MPAVKSDVTVTVFLDDVPLKVPSNTTIADALQTVGFRFNKPGREPSLACRTGGCWSCALPVDGRLERTCVTPVRNGIRISTSLLDLEPLRIVHGPEPHLVGGKATPWWEVDYVHYVEAAIWTAGCNLSCPQCQNFTVTYDNSSPPLKPREAARLLAACHNLYRTRGVAVSGGEPTLNRLWLCSFFRELSKLLPPRVRKHLDSNGTILSRDYVDELVENGCNNIGVEPKCVSVTSYMKITGLRDEEFASRYLENAWRIAQYIYENYRDRVYLGIGLVYNPRLVSLEEIADAGTRVASIGDDVQVTVLDYFPAFRRRDIERPSFAEMLKVKKILEAQGLKTVIVQTSRGRIGPGEKAD
ncbi:MAG: radical SAM protein [Thermofilaceae archaeon]|nr:radical SAM protein [Thermofilaceae archaeon]MDW8003394.1 radical SAM protein [Thermofilaceae archaeon]